MKFNTQILAHMRAATQRLLAQGPSGATAAIQQALAGVRAQQEGAQQQPDAAPQPAMRDINPPPPHAATQRPDAPQAQAASPAASSPHASAAAEPPAAAPQHAAQAFAADLLARLGVPAGGGAGFDMPKFDLPKFDAASFDLSGLDLSGLDLPGMRAPGTAPPMPSGAQFVNGSYRNHAGARNYKLYIPSSYHGQAMPLLVMLHGCTQDPDDFAAGTQMNAVAEEQQCFVVYPAQSASANNHKCWNWFNALDQQHGQGEPSIIAGIAQQVIDEYPVNERQVYVAGLSAGGAMAVIVGALYPELFAAVGVHSGLPFASAKDLPSALSAMKGGAAGMGGSGGPGVSVPIIVFHGDKDSTVHPRNGEQVMAQRLRAEAAAKAAAKVDSGSVPNGHRYTRTTHSQQDGAPLGEHWVVHGAGHAWSGGSTAGSYTDGKGPDASREMMRFFTTLG